MKQSDLFKISAAQHQLLHIREIHNRFTTFVINHAKPNEFPTEIKCEVDDFSIDWYGIVAKATPTYVIDTSDDTFAVEYRFLVSQNDESDKPIEVWRFYLSANGVLVDGFESRNQICTYDNKYIASNICGPVILGLLNSSLLQPTPPVV